MKKFFIILGLFLFKTSILFGCSCERKYFCDDYSDLSEDRVFIKGKVIDHVEYSHLNVAVYIEVLDILRDDVGISDTIKLFGDNTNSSCRIYPYGFKVDSEIYLGLGLTYSGNPIGYDVVDPDLEQDKYWSFGPSLCSTIKLRIKNDIVRGAISEQDLIYEYPLEFFESNLESCSFSLQELNTLKCNSGHFMVYPNPSNGEEINLKNEYFYSSITRVNIYSVDGKLKKQLNFTIDSFQKVKFELDNSGIYILEIFCEEQVYYKKVVVK